MDSHSHQIKALIRNQSIEDHSGTNTSFTSPILSRYGMFVNPEEDYITSDLSFCLASCDRIIRSIFVST